VILDTKGNIFGGFTPLEWDSNSGVRADDSLKSFLFTLKNPNNIPAKRFALKAERKGEAIYCGSESGPHFRNLAVCDDCNLHTYSTTFLGYAYINDTRKDPEIVFTGSKGFQVKEIEVFEIID
jgi:hypothetical protein